MKLQARNLSLRMRGEDVALLHKELMQFEYTIAENELQRMYFGTTTRQAVLDFQKKQDLEGSGIVDRVSAKRINEALERQVEWAPPTTNWLIRPGRNRTWRKRYCC